MTAFCAQQAHWLEDYALFRALKAKYHGAYYLELAAGLGSAHPEALAEARRELASQIDQVRFAQFLLFRQADQLKEHAHARGVGLIGDLPFLFPRIRVMSGRTLNYSCLTSSIGPDSSPEFLPIISARKDNCGAIPFTTGTPPRSTGYRWCIDRLRALLAHVDVIRLDHFRGFAAAWHVPAGAPTAQSGQWVPGPGASFFQAVETELGHLPFIAEDLG
jgi:4-alpha-glucanotransferase